MDNAGLCELQVSLKEKYRNDPGAAVVTLRAMGDLGGDKIACKVETRGALVETGLDPATGGSGIQACSGDMLLEALVACAGVTLKAVATAIDFRLRGGSVSAEGDLDFRGMLGAERSAPVGFREIRINFALDTDEPEETSPKLAQVDRALLRRPADAAYLTEAGDKPYPTTLSQPDRLQSTSV